VDFALHTRTSPHEALVLARRAHWEDPAGSLETAVRCQHQGRTLGDAALQSRALSLQGAVSLHRGDLRGAFELAAEAERHLDDDLRARAELAALNTGLHFFSGSYGDSLRSAELAVALADRSRDLLLRIHARRMACLAFGNLGVDDWPQRLADLLALTIEAGDGWEEAISRNDLAHCRMVGGELGAAGEEIERAMAIARGLPQAGFALGVLHCTRAEIRLGGGRPEDAMRDADRAIELLTATGEANPYLLGMTVLMKVQALLALGRVEGARRAGEEALGRLGDRVPQARSMILGAVAGALREAGRAEEAYDALARCAELEREALREFSQLQLGLERARLEMAAARREADALNAKNQELEALVAELAGAHAELGERTRQLEHLQEKLREQADRDWLTGLRNRRYLARASADEIRGPVSLAVLDLDHFKSINDRFGHQAGDRVLVRVAELLVACVRGTDVVVRTGGEEFAVLMPATPADAAAECCERLRAVIDAEPWERIAPGLAMTASIGVVSTAEASDFGELGRVADERLYSAKAAGRNRVVATS
jgi:diguanylate cyclase (GGDEF)-like protein